jgi:hypothetical protein
MTTTRKIILTAIGSVTLIAIAIAAEIGSYPNATALTGTERILADQAGGTVNVTPAQLSAFTLTGPATVTAPASAVPTLILSGTSTATMLQVNSANGATQGTVDAVVVRSSGSTANALAQGANWELADTINSSASLWQNSGGQTEVWQENTTWHQLAFWNTNRGLTLNAPASGAGLSVTGSANGYAGQFLSNGTSGQSFGLKVNGGTTSADAALSVNSNGGTTSFLYAAGDGGVIVGNNLTSPGAQNLKIMGTALIPGMASGSAVGGYVCWTSGTGLLVEDTAATCPTSAERFKRDIVSLPSALAEVMALRPVNYVPKDAYNPQHRGDQLGLIAEEVAKVDGRLADYDSAGLPVTVQYDRTGVLAIKAIQEQQRQIARLARTVRAQHKRITALEARKAL